MTSVVKTDTDADRVMGNPRADEKRNTLIKKKKVTLTAAAVIQSLTLICLHECH